MPNVRKLTRASRRKGLVYTELESYPDGTRLHPSDGADWLGSALNIGEDPAGVNPVRVRRGSLGGTTREGPKTAPPHHH
jgi:hypothetical protein